MFALILYFLISINGLILASSKSEPRVNVLYSAQFDECEGKDGGNYTLWWEYTINLNADANSIRNSDNQLVQCGARIAVNQLKTLARSVYPAGAYVQIETLWLATTGPLQGKYLYEKVIILSLSYIKRFSSVLGYSYTSSKSSSLLINENLDIAVLISPIGGYEIFKRGCTTTCRGRAFSVA